MNYAIVYKTGAKPNSPYAGTVRPVIVEHDGIVSEVQPNDFPNDDMIFVAGGYDSSLENFGNNEIFRISYRENLPNGQDTSSRYYCAYVTYGDNATRLERYEYLHLIEGEFDLNNRKYFLSYEPERLIVLKSLLNDTLYGPFDYNVSRSPDQEMYEVVLKPYLGLTKFHIPENSVLKLSSYQFKVLPLFGQSNQIVLLAHVEDIITNKYEVIDYLPDDQLLKLGNTLLQDDKKLNRNELTSFRSAIADMSESSLGLDAPRKERLLALVSKLDYWKSQSSSLLNEYLKTADGTAKVDQYIQEHPSDFIENLKKIAGENIEEQRKQLQKEIDDLGETKQSLVDEVNTLENKKQSVKQEITESQTEPLKLELAQLQVEIDRKKSELETFNDAVSLQENIKALQKKHDDLEAVAAYQRNIVSELETTKTSLSEAIKSTDKQRKEELIRVATKEKPYLDILNGIAPVWSDAKQSEKRAIDPRRDIPDATSLIKEISRNFEEFYGRNYSFEDIANFLICVDQNFLTVLSGLPGVGKTSAVTCFAEILGLRSQECFLNIPTARGFTSQRDLLGFYNPLSQRFQPAATGLYEFLADLKKSDRAYYSHWVLLDEANLSPMEHYFSSFLGMCDLPFDDGAKIIKTGALGVEGILKIPASFRFLATINYDNTTEPLSPRMIDRVPIIRIEPPKEDNFNFVSPELPDRKMLSYADLNSIFRSLPTEQGNDGELTLEEGRILRNVRDALSSSSAEGVPTIVSPRKLHSIQQYCSAARELMRDEGGASSLTSMDYAICQHILPLINGNSPKYRKRLDELLKAINSLFRSRRMLENIIQTGEDEQHFYRFFI